MYKKIIAAINEHVNSEVSARYALNLSKNCGAKFYISFIAKNGMERASFERAENAVKRLFLEAEKLGVEVESIIETGDPFQRILEIVKGEGIDILFASTRREDLKSRFYAGSLTRRLMIGLPCSVAMVRVVHMGKIRPKKILLPLKANITNIKERAYFSAKIAESFNSKIFIFHVTKPITKFFHGEIHLTPAQLEKSLPPDISKFVEYLKEYCIDVEKRLLSGKPSKNITIEALTKRHDLIIMGVSERGLLSTIIKGNPVEEVLRETPCDLIILKPRHED
jgi:nucleotide-binding universal stress UspA family protein